MSQSNITLGRLSLYYAGFYIGFSVLVMALIAVIEIYFQIGFDGNAMGIIIPYVSALQCGTIWFNRTGTRPARGLAWKVGLIFTVISVILSLAIAAASISLGAFPELAEIRNDPNAMPILAAVIVGVGAFLVVVCRFGFGMGARQAEKLKQKQDAKAAR